MREPMSDRQLFSARVSHTVVCHLALLGLSACAAAHDRNVGSKASGPEPGFEACEERADNLSSEQRAQLACGGVCERAECSTGACLPELFAHETDEPTALAVDDTHLYWGNSKEHVIRRRALQGGETEEFLKIETVTAGMAIHGGRLFWTTPTRAGVGFGLVQSASLADRSRIGLAGSTSPESIAVTDSRVYWADFQEGIYSVEHTDGTPIGTPTRFEGYANAIGVSVIGKTLFWTQMNLDNSIRFRDLASDRAGLVVCNQQWPTSIVVDEQHLYWISRDIDERTGRIMILARTGGQPRVLLDRQAEPGPAALAGDDTALYWVEGRTSIMRVLK